MVGPFEILPEAPSKESHNSILPEQESEAHDNKEGESTRIEVAKEVRFLVSIQS